ncbi:MAG: hypothetical protein JNJ59_01810 [Deltaproteobacteria bacterium]|nr:hypothetical protein [Deltaproteobacteria bacterium]
MPWISDSSSKSTPLDLSGAFFGHDCKLPWNSIPEFVALRNFVLANSELRRRLLPSFLRDPESPSAKSDSDEKYASLADLLATNLASDVLDRYVHVTGQWTFDVDEVLRVAAPNLAVIFEPELKLDVCVPILFVRFDFDSELLGERAAIERIEEDYQLARAGKYKYGPGVHESVLGGATHWLVLKDFAVQNPGRSDLYDIFSDARAYPIPAIDAFFAALRLGTGADTGYAQLLVRPHNWCLSHKAMLPPLEGTSLRAYPYWFEDFRWLAEDLPSVGEEQAAVVRRIYSRLSENSERSMNAAVRRMNRCYLRDDEDDAAVDATIGLEALLADDEKTELTHKLALRVAALLQLLPDNQLSPSQVFRDIRAIYKHRSEIVHGEKRVEKTRMISLPDRSTQPASALALKYLRSVVEVLLEHPQYLKPAAIDELILAKLRSN